MDQPAQTLANLHARVNAHRKNNEKEGESRAQIGNRSRGTGTPKSCTHAHTNTETNQEIHFQEKINLQQDLGGKALKLETKAKNALSLNVKCHLASLTPFCPDGDDKALGQEH